MKVRIEGLSKDYGRVSALKDIDLSIGSGMFGLLGPNGAGKSTLMRVLTTLLPPTRGTATIGGYDVRRHKREVRRMLGYLPQDFGLYRKLSAAEFLELVAGLKGITGKAKKSEVERVLRQVDLWENRRQLLGGYSGGMKRRVGIAQALLGDPKLLIVDEPTAGLDPEGRVRFRNLLTELSGDRVVVLSTHIVGDIESSCNNLAVLRRGRVVFAGTQGQLTAGAAGRVWRVTIGEMDMPRLKNVGQVVSARRDGDHLVVRVVSRENPLGQGQPVEPDLEDGYMALVEPDGAGDASA